MRKRSGAYSASTLVLVLTGAFLFYGLTLNHVPEGRASLFHAIFSSANGLDAGDDVMLGGVRVGTVRSIRLNATDGVADVAFSVREHLSLPVATSVRISAASMTGGNVLEVVPGKGRDSLKNGAIITDAFPMLSLEQQISNYIFGAGKL